MKKFLILLLGVILLTGASCQINKNLISGDGLENLINTSNEGTRQNNATAEFPDSSETTGTVEVVVINEITNKPIAGNSLSCSGCINYNSEQGEETDVNGKAKFEMNKNDKIYLSQKKTDWNNYDSVNEITAGSTIIIKAKPQVVGTGSEIYFLDAVYSKNSSKKIQLHLTYKDSSGRLVPNYTIYISGPIVGSARSFFSVKTNSNGIAIADLPTNGSYRITLPKTVSGNIIYDFYQFESPSGYNSEIVLDLSKKDKMISGTASLSKNYQERGMILVCVRDSKTKKPVSVSISSPQTNTLYTRSVKHDNDICVEVPKSVQTVGIPTDGNQNGHADVSTSAVDENEIMYLYVQTIK